MSGDSGRTQVLVVGAGPCGLTAANLLGQAGVDTLVIERGDDLLALPRAVSVDDESMRVLQAAGLEREAYDIVLPGTGTKYFGRREDVCLGYARGPAVHPYGHPPKNPIDQPEFDRMLLDGLARFPNVEVRFGTRLDGLDPGSDDVVAHVSDGDDPYELTADYVLGCDGGRSSVRECLDVEMVGDSWPDEWIVLDTVNDHHRERYAMHHGDPDRPYVIVPGRDGRCRYEFRVLPGEEIGDPIPFELIQRLLEHHRPGLSCDDLVRAAVYQFHAIVAKRWRAGRVLLLGDAAHMMPPFAGQGLNSAIRDASNLAWKVAGVLRGELGERVLDTYERERRPHAEAMIRLSRRLGGVVMTASPLRAAIRDLVLVGASHVPWTRRYIEQMRFKPATRVDSEINDLLEGPRHRLVGEMLPQAAVLREDLSRVMLDEVLGPGFAIVVVGGPEPGVEHERLGSALRATVVRLELGDLRPAVGGRSIAQVSDADGMLTAALSDVDGKVVVVRPDRFVAGVLERGQEEAFARSFRMRLGQASEPAEGRTAAGAATRAS